ncbi:MAG: hypothetical protein AAGJ35_10755, partial [Myxococcota bacterium]
MFQMIEQVATQRPEWGLSAQRVRRARRWLDGQLGRLLGLRWKRGVHAVFALAQRPFAYGWPDEQRLITPIQIQLRRLRLLLKLPLQNSFLLRFSLRRLFRTLPNPVLEQRYSGMVSFWMRSESGPQWVLILEGQHVLFIPLPPKLPLQSVFQRQRVWNKHCLPLLKQFSSQASTLGYQAIEERLSSTAHVQAFFSLSKLLRWSQAQTWRNVLGSPLLSSLQRSVQPLKSVLFSAQLSTEQLVLREVLLFRKHKGQKRPFLKTHASLQTFPQWDPQAPFRSVQQNLIWRDATRRFSAHFSKLFAMEKKRFQPLFERMRQYLHQQKLLRGGGGLFADVYTSYAWSVLSNMPSAFWQKPHSTASAQKPLWMALFAAQRWQKQILLALLQPLCTRLHLRPKQTLYVWWPPREKPLSLAWHGHLALLTNHLSHIGH